MSRIQRIGPLLLTLAFAAAGCGGGDAHGGAGSAKGAPQVTADKVCRGVLSTEGAKALGIMTDAKKYSPDDVETDPAKAVAELVASYVPGAATDVTTFTQEAKGRACKVTPVGGPLWGAEVDLSFVNKRDAKGSYRLGANVAYADDVLADLYFPCRSAKLSGSGDDQLLVKAELNTSPHSGTRTPGTAAQTERLRQANLTFLNSVAYVTAKDLGCSGNGGVRAVAAPEKLSPTPSTSTSASRTEG